jgi:hypothetical protein
MKKTITFGVALLTLALLLIATKADETSVGLTGTAEIICTCGIRNVGQSSNPFKFHNNLVDTLVVGTVSEEEYVKLYNPGSCVTAGLEIYGADWTYGSGTVGNTKYLDNGLIDCSGISNYDTTMTSLKTTPGDTLTNIVEDQTFNYCLRLKIPEGTTAGSYTQTITFETTC